MKTLRSLFITCLLLAATGGRAQPHTSMEQQNPLLCDPATGACTLPAQGDTTGTPQPLPAQKPVRILYFTDPICSSCWGIEPQLRRLKLEYGDQVEVTYHMGGLLPDWSYNSGGISQPSDVARHWDEVSHYYRMPIDGNVWLEDPLDSSYPPSIAFKAAQMQDPGKAVVFLRRLREMVFLEKKNITRWEHLAAAAVAAGLDSQQLHTDYNGAAETSFRADLALARQMGVRGFPSMFFTENGGKQAFLYGFKPYSSWEDLLQSIYPGATRVAYKRDWQALFTVYPTLTSREFAELSDLDPAQTEALLESLCRQGQLRKQQTRNGVLWQRQP